MEIKDFSAALRAMADDVDVLAERHDVAQIARLQREADVRAALTRRDGDLIDELRRQVTVMGRSLDAIGRMRKSVSLGDADAATSVQILAEALLVIDGKCENSTSPSTCRNGRRTRGAVYVDEA